MAVLYRIQQFYSKNRAKFGRIIMSMRKIRLSINMPKGYSKILHAIILVLSIFGIIMVTSASMYNANNDTLTNLVIKELIFFVGSYAIMVFLAQNFSWKWFRYSSKVFFFIVLATIIILIIPRFFNPIYGSYNWIQLGPLSLQPSELSKPVIIAIIASTLGSLPYQKWMSDPKKLKKLSAKAKLSRVWTIIQWPVLAAFIMLGIVFAIQNDFGTFMIMLITASVLVFMASHPFITNLQRVLLFLFVVAMGAAVFMMTPNGIQYLESLGLKQYQLQRVTSLYNLFERDSMLRESMQQVNGLLAFAKGGLIGNGLGSSILKYGYIPATDSDYILAILIDEFGFIGFLLLTIGYVVILGILFKNAFKVSHQPSRLFLIGAATYIFVHYLFNVGGTSGLIPLTGVPLLLISAGGSSQLAVFMTIGIAQNIIARNKDPKKKRI